MFEHLKVHPVILVTGPQRSGTTICSHMISQDTGHKLVDEADYGIHNTEKFLQYTNQKNVVIHCPAQMHVACQLDALVVCMIRPTHEICHSEKRIGWKALGGEPAERHIYQAEQDPRSMSEIKYDFWRNNLPAHYLEQDYYALSGHKLWLSASERIGFHSRQTKKI